jgi:hypothetical protein
MKFSKTVFPFVLFTFFLSAPSVFAEDITPVPSRATRRLQNEDRQEVRQEIKLDLRATMAQNRLNSRISNAQKIAAKIRLQLTKRFDYLIKIKSRLADRIAKIETANLTAEKKRDMTAAKAKLASYSPVKYNASLKEFDDLVATIANIEKPQTIVPLLRASAKNIQNDLKNLHQDLIDTLKLIVKASKPTLTPTSTL